MMTELEKIAYAKSFIDKLAAGVDPTNDSPIPEGDVAAKSRIAGCFSFVSDLLGKLVNAPDVTKNLYRTPERTVTPAVLAAIECSQYPISITQFARNIDAALSAADKFTAADLNPWLLHNGYLEKLVDYRGKTVKRPTQKGIEIGIIVDQYVTVAGNATHTVKLNLFAQRFIRDHLSEILAFSPKIPKESRVPNVTFSLTRAQLASYEISQEPISISQIASKISALNPSNTTASLKAADLAEWLLHLGVLKVESKNGKNYKLPTDAGIRIGVSAESRMGQNGEYIIALYNAEAEQFILDHIHALVHVTD